MNREQHPSGLEPRTLAALALISMGLFAILTVAAGERAADIMAIGLRVYVMASHVVAGLLDQHLDTLVRTIALSWALMAAVGVWILWRASQTPTRARKPHEVSDGG